MRLAMLAVLVAAQLLPVAHLTVDVTGPPPVRAGQRVVQAGTVQLHGPADPMPGLAGEVDLSMDAPDAAGCRLSPTSGRLDPATGRLPFEVICRPQAPGDHPLEVLAEATPYEPATWNGTLIVHPDRLAGQLSVGEVDGFDVPLHLELQPEHLDLAPVNLTWTSELAGTPLAFQATDGPVQASAGLTREHRWTARHGPGTYTLTLVAEGPLTDPWATQAEIVVPSPPRNGSLLLDLTVTGPGPTVALTGDSVNDDGKHKRPGDELITRLDATHTDTLEVRVLRPVGDRTVQLANRTLQVGPDGEAEHRFSHPYLPAGPLVVQAQAGNTSVARTAEIQDVPTSATVTGPASIPGDGRAVPLTARFNDPNLGSTPQDPGPVWGLPDIRWTVFRGTQPAPGWNVSLGPFAGGPEGIAELSRLAWPSGAPWAEVQAGQATVEAGLEPPADVDPGTYRLSLYDPDGDRIGGHTLEVEPVPRIDLTGGTPVPTEGWPVNLTVSDPRPGLEINLTLRADGRSLGPVNLTGPAATVLPLASTLPAGTSLVAEAWATWPGRPAAQGPDARLVATVPALPPRLDIQASVDGVPLPLPLAVHPAGEHEIVLHPGTIDPNGDPVELTAKVTAPDGKLATWETTVDDRVILQVPRDQPAGRYIVALTATTPIDEPVVSHVPVDVAPVTRLAVQGPEAATLETTTTENLPITVTNTGTTPLQGLVADLRGPPGLTGRIGLPGEDRVSLGEVLPVGLAPGGSAEVVLELVPDEVVPGDHEARLTIAGVIP